VDASSAVSRNCGRTVKKKAEQWLRDVAKKWRVRTEGSGVAHGGDVVYIVMDKTRRAALCIEGALVMTRVKKQGKLDGLKVITG